MKRTKEAAPGVASTESGELERSTLTGEAHSNTDYTMLRGPVARVLLTGKENALPGREIRRILGLKDQRDVTALVERERRGGIPICATCDSRNPGYYLPASPGELQDYTRSLQGRIREVSATLDAMETTLDNWTGQQRFDVQEEGGKRI